MERIELKFDITKYSFSKIINKYNLFKIYPDRIVNSIYYDTKNLDLYNDSEEGITPRKKFRVRSYNNDLSKNFEIKQSLSYSRKKIIIKNIKDPTKYLKLYSSSQNLFPIVKIIYTRNYFKSIFGRVTIDSNINYFLLNHKLNILKKYKSKLKVLEVKNDLENFDKNEILNSINLKETRFSKYCNAVTMLYYESNEVPYEDIF